MSPLSKLQSRAAGYGSHCAEKLGWPYPSEDEARRILQERGEEPSDEEMEAEVRAEYEMERRHEQWLDNGGPHAEAIARDAELDRMHEDPAMSMSSQYTGEEPWWDHGNQS